MLVSQTESIFLQLGTELKLPSALVDFLPTLLLWSFTALMPLLVSWSDRFMGHWTRSYENHSIMKKTFWYLVFAVIILPTLGFTAASSFIKGVWGGDNSTTIRWECVFLPDSGAFFVNYIITASLMGAGLELIRFPDLVWYAVQICWSKSEADTPAIRQAIKYEFRFGEQYARSLMIFCAIIMFSVSCPLITPFGLLYFITKHYVDRHNLQYAYKPSKINKRVHGTAISFVILSTVILQFAMMLFTFVRSKGFNDMNIKTKVAIGSFLLSVNIFSAQLWADTCKKCSPIEYMECTILRDDENQLKDFIYLPDVLKAEEDKREACDADDSDTAVTVDADGAPLYASHA